jgi:hypothetical protein
MRVWEKYFKAYRNSISDIRSDLSTTFKSSLTYITIAITIYSKTDLAAKRLNYNG